MSVLRNAGLVTDERQGLNIFYRLIDERIGDLLNDLAALTPCEANVAKLHALQESIAGCPCPNCVETGTDGTQPCRVPEDVEQTV